MNTNQIESRVNEINKELNDMIFNGTITTQKLDDLINELDELNLELFIKNSQLKEIKEG